MSKTSRPKLRLVFPLVALVALCALLFTGHSYLFLLLMWTILIFGNRFDPFFK